MKAISKTLLTSLALLPATIFAQSGSYAGSISSINVPHETFVINGKIFALNQKSRLALNNEKVITVGQLKVGDRCEIYQPALNLESGTCRR